MPISYQEAVAIVLGVADARSNDIDPRGEDIPLVDAAGRRTVNDVRSTADTPRIDSSAMDGYAVSSALTALASTISPLRLEVKGTMAAGDSPMRLSNSVDEEGLISSVEVMTGATFPESLDGPPYDACIPWEQTRSLAIAESGRKVVEITRPPRTNQHRRFAGDDFRKDDIILRTGEKIGLQHIMAMSSVGLSSVAVQRRLSAVVLTTGSELKSSRSWSSQDPVQLIPDCNGPFLTAGLRELGTEVKSVSGVPDQIEDLQSQMRKAVSSSRCEILVTTGGVSAGKFDFVPQAVQNLGGSIHFHHVAMRPGHPVLFASISSQQDGGQAREVAVFGLPGNPVAAAACFRFLVDPYVRALQGELQRPPRWKAAISAGNDLMLSNRTKEHDKDSKVIYRREKALDIFRHGYLQVNGDQAVVTFSSEQSPAKLRPFSRANCWVHIPNDRSEVRAGELLDCHSL